ncbi:MAG: transglutaminase-like domain-containing protein [Thermosphaera sp.]
MENQACVKTTRECIVAILFISFIFLMGEISLWSENNKLQKTLYDITQTYEDYTSFDRALKRFLILEEVQATKQYVEVAGVSTYSGWESYRRLYEWVVSNIKYAYDPEIPVPVCEKSSECYFVYRHEYVQPPSFTLRRGQGDCEDMALLLYAMMKYYDIYYLGKEYRIWLADIDFKNSKSGHVAVIVPMKGGYVGILDPAGKFVDVGPVKYVLEKYDDWWSDEGGIKTITLYRVEVLRGEYYEDASGSFGDIVAYIIKSVT